MFSVYSYVHFWGIILFALFWWINLVELFWWIILIGLFLMDCFLLCVGFVRWFVFGIFYDGFVRWFC